VGRCIPTVGVGLARGLPIAGPPTWYFFTVFPATVIGFLAATVFFLAATVFFLAGAALVVRFAIIGFLIMSDFLSSFGTPRTRHAAHWLFLLHKTATPKALKHLISLFNGIHGTAQHSAL